MSTQAGAAVHTRDGYFEVWAPLAGAVDLVVEDTTHPMTAAAEGWWTVRVPDGTAVQTYGFRVHPAGTDADGDEAGAAAGSGDEDLPVLPDPRSRRQPDGVHGRSAVFDPSAHRWRDTAWTGRPLAGGLVYELHIGTFTPEGTFDAATERLPHLVDLGVTHVEVLPVNGVNGTHNWGYDGVLWYTVHEPYGGPAGYQRFVDACHAAGLAVVQDVVYNHLGPSGNYLPTFGPYLHTERANTWGAGMNLDGEHSDVVRRYILDNLAMWFEDYHVDGLRLDAVHALVDHRAVHLLEQMAVETDVRAAHLGRPLTLIAESDMNDPRLITSREAGGYGLTAQWSDDFHHCLHVALTGETTGYYEDFASLSAFAKVLERGFFHDGTLSTFRGRRHGRQVDVPRMPASRFVVFAQDHDQIGNRAIGDRLTATLPPAALKLGALVLFASPFTPMLFMGEEWGASTPWQFFTSHPEPDLGKATAEGRIEEFAKMGWDPATVPDPQDPETFTRSKLDWSEPDGGDHADVLRFYRALGALRRAETELTDPRLYRVTATADDASRTLTVTRGQLVLLANFSAEPAALPVPAGCELVLATDDTIRVDGDSVSVPGPGGVLLRLPEPVQPE
ncbi:malto-oligosyltrehalose trehalohydrolase [Nakamurella endophytica]|uniref:Malto-oligosyltrehalose trehalohydrolase n=1 Tax=Nakamurella endophytica TaxID=1748367 RepID=A0A917WDH9_9ACTN|nr:malto-oligosyltrehalose trehalohydrolase [Nakamurella endophytica]GGL92889.1 malto-oligosyltrehalose trehalohydrolase [Nakamurella endophytica]